MTQGKDKELGIEDKSERREVTAAAVGRELRTFARVKWPLANDKARKQALRRILDVTERRIKSLWEGEETAVPRGTETALIEELIGHKIGAAAEEKNDALGASQQAHRTLEARVAALEGLFASIDPEFGSEFLAAFRASLDGAGGGARSRRAGDGPGDQSEDLSDFSD